MRFFRHVKQLIKGVHASMLRQHLAVLFMLGR